jgi:diacylglycerol kinase family enzyme
MPLTQQDNEVLILANPFSGTGHNRQHVNDLASALAGKGVPVLIVWEKAERDALLANDEQVAKCRCIVAAGGDGTLLDIINHDPPAPLVLLPLGNENLIAKHFGHTTDVDQMVDIIMGNARQPVDIGRVNDTSFCLSVSAGFDADVIHRLARWRTKRKGLRRVNRLSYIRPVLGSFLQYQYPEIKIEADGECCTGVQVIVFNVPLYPLGIQFAPKGRVDDGLLDWVVFRKPGRWNLLRFLRAAYRGKLSTMADALAGQAKQITISSATPVPVQVDGDPHGMTPVSITLCAGQADLLGLPRQEMAST